MCSKGMIIDVLMESKAQYKPLINSNKDTRPSLA